MEKKARTDNRSKAQNRKTFAKRKTKAAQSDDTTVENKQQRGPVKNKKFPGMLLLCLFINSFLLFGC